MDLESLSNELWVLLWDLASWDEICFSAVESVFAIIGEGRVHQYRYP